jgi:hypothetical protein
MTLKFLNYFTDSAVEWLSDSHQHPSIFHPSSESWLPILGS